MKKLLAVIGLLGMMLCVSVVKAEQSPGAYEYASFSSMGTKSSIIWPDGSILRIEDRYKRPGDANEKMFYMTMAFNILAKEGYEVFSGDTTPTAFNMGHENDLMFRRHLK